MLNSTIHFISELPSMGDRIKVREDCTEINSRMNIAKTNNKHNIIVTGASNGSVLIPLHMIALVTSNSRSGY